MHICVVYLFGGDLDTANLVNIRITKLNVRQFYIFIETFAVSLIAILIAYLKSSYLYLKKLIQKVMRTVLVG